MNWLVHVFLWGLFLDSLIGLIDKDKCTITAKWNSSKHFAYCYMTFGMQNPTLQDELSEHELSGLKLISDLTMWWLLGTLQRMEVSSGRSLGGIWSCCHNAYVFIQWST